MSIEIAPGIFITALSQRCKPGTTLTTQSPLKFIKLVSSNCINFLFFHFKLVNAVLAQFLCNLLGCILSRRDQKQVHVKGSISSTFQPEHTHLTMCDDFKMKNNLLPQ